jgi:hypothetical protein
MIDGGIENRQLMVDAPFELSVVMMPAAGGENRAFRVGGREAADGFGAALRNLEIVKPELEKTLSVFHFPPGVFDQSIDT